MKIIFLDIDGVLNCEQGFVDGLCKYTIGKEDMGMDFYPPSKKLLNKLIDETNGKVVISSTWRRGGLDKMKEIWDYRNMHGEIIGVTPYLRAAPRGVEIEYWLKERNFYHINWSQELQEKSIKESNIENYVIIDDDSDMLYRQRNHFVHVFPSPRNVLGFNEEHFKKCREILNSTVIKLNQDEYTK